MRARRGAEGGHRVRSPRHPQDRRPSQDRTPVPTSYRNGKAGGSSQGSSDNKRPSQFSGGNGKNSKGKNNTGLYLAVGGIALLVILCIVLVLKFSGKQGAETPESSETEATFAQDVLLQPAVLDLSVLPGAAELTATSAENSTEESGSGAAATGLLDIQGMTPEEVRAKVAELYSWNLVVYNDKADVGAVVKPTVDANATTEAATLGDAENPDSLPKDEAETTDPALQEITVTNEYAVPDLVNEKLNELLTQIVADNEAYRQQMSEEAAAEYPDLTPQERERELAKRYGAIFLIGIGYGNPPHSGRAPDYDDWSTETENGYHGLNGDIIVWDTVRSDSLELSSMGIRVSRESLLKQLEIRGCMERKELYWHKRLLGGEYPQTIGGGVGQSRLCMFLLHKAHIGEVQASVWQSEAREEARAKGFALL